MEIKFKADYINEAENFKVGSLEKAPGYAMIVEDKTGKYFGEAGISVIFGITDAEHEWINTDEQRLIGLAQLLGNAAPRDRILAQIGNMKKQRMAQSIDNGVYAAQKRIKMFGYASADESLKWIANSVLKSDKVETELIDGSSIETICRMIVMHEELIARGEKLPLAAEKRAALIAGLGKRVRSAEEIFAITSEQGGVFVNNGSAFLFSKLEYAPAVAGALKAQGAKVNVTKLTGSAIGNMLDALKKAGVGGVVINAGHAEARIDCETVMPAVLKEDPDEYDELTLSELIPYYNTARRMGDGERASAVREMFYERLFAADELYMMYNKSLGDKYPTIDANGFAWFFTDEEIAEEIKKRNSNIDLEYKAITGAQLRRMLEGEFYRLGIMNIRFNCGRNYADVERDAAVKCAAGVSGFKLTNSHMMFEMIRFMQARGANTKETAQMTAQHMNEAFHDFTNTVFVAPMYYDGERGRNVCDKNLHFSARASEMLKDKNVNFYNEGEITGFAENMQGQKVFYETLTKHEQGKPDTLWMPVFSDYKECFKMFDRHKYRLCVVTFEDIAEQVNDTSVHISGVILNCRSIGINVPADDINNLKRVNDKNRSINELAGKRPEFDISEKSFCAVVLDTGNEKDGRVTLLCEAIAGSVSVGDEVSFTDAEGRETSGPCVIAAINILSRDGRKAGNKVGISFDGMKPEDFKAGTFMVGIKKAESIQQSADNAKDDTQKQSVGEHAAKTAENTLHNDRKFVNREAVERAIAEQKQIIEETKHALFGQKAKRRAAAMEELASLEEELKKY